MSTNATPVDNPYPDVPAPPGISWISGWMIPDADAPLRPFRVFRHPRVDIGEFTIQKSGRQSPDGTIEGLVISVGVTESHTLIDNAEIARELAHELLIAADEIDSLDDGDCTYVLPGCSGEDDDTRTPAQHLSDIAAATLARLHRLSDELGHLEGQLDVLTDWAAEHDLADRGEFLARIADTVHQLDCCVPEAVRDIASTLPVRGIDFGEDR